MTKLGIFVLLAMVLSTESFLTMDCTPNGTYSTCPGSCPETCALKSRMCHADCGESACICKPGYIIDSDIPACVLRSDCPKHVQQATVTWNRFTFSCYGTYCKISKG